MQQHKQVLSSWKEIADYLGRGVRTVQRYETLFGFPVWRPSRERRSSVVALSNEIDAWVSDMKTRDSMRSQTANPTEQAVLHASAHCYHEGAAFAHASARQERECVQALFEKIQKVCGSGLSPNRE